MTHPLVIVSDVHLGHRECRGVASDLARLVTRHPGHEVVLNGDTFNLSCDPYDRDPGTSAAAMLTEHPGLTDALRRHLAGGHPLTIVAGNHDMGVQQRGFRDALIAILAGDVRGDLRIEPWLIRRGDVHIEHGHLYDPANSPTHPLALPSFRTEPVGIGLTRRFVGPLDAWELLAQQWTARTSDGLKLMVRYFGARTPVVVLRYLALLAIVNAECAVPSRLTAERQRGESALAGYAAQVDLSSETLRALIDARQRPLHFSFLDTLHRFGFDEALAQLAIPAGVVAALVTSRFGPLASSVMGSGYLIAERKRLSRRSANHMPDALRSGAATVRRLTGARLVVFGHSHLDEETDGYLNLGAFGDTPRTTRSYVHVDEHGRAERRQLDP